MYIMLPIFVFQYVFLFRISPVLNQPLLYQVLVQVQQEGLLSLLIDIHQRCQIDYLPKLIIVSTTTTTTIAAATIMIMTIRIITITTTITSTTIVIILYIAVVAEISI